MSSNIESAFQEISGSIKVNVMKGIYIFLFFINTILLFIIPFMYFTVKETMPMYDKALSTMNLFSMFNALAFTFFAFLSFILRSSRLSKIVRFSASYSSENLKESMTSLIASIKRINLAILFLLLFSSFFGFITAFMYVTGPLVLHHNRYLFNTVPMIIFLTYVVLTFPGLGYFRKILVKK